MEREAILSVKRLMVLLLKMVDTADSVVSLTLRYNSSRTVFIPLIRAVASDGAVQYIHEYYSQDCGEVIHSALIYTACAHV